jgi:hypothetical protein
MDSSMANKIIKARQYAEQPERIHVVSMTVEMEGDYHTHSIGFDHGEWSCDCGFFASHRVCAHTMALERVLGPMVKVPA